METSDLEPKYPSSIVWKSENVKEQERFERMKRLVNNVAPQQVKGLWSRDKRHRNQSRQFSVIPQTFHEYLQHRIDVLESNITELRKAIAHKEEEVKICKDQDLEGRSDLRAMAFGGKKFEDGRGPTLSQRTIWSCEWQNNNYPTSAWPNQEAIKLNTARHRALPRPDSDPSRSSDLRHQDSPLDARERHSNLHYRKYGPLPNFGVLDPLAAEIAAQNRVLRNDPEFEERGKRWLGEGVVEEL